MHVDGEALKQKAGEIAPLEHQILQAASAGIRAAAVAVEGLAGTGAEGALEAFWHYWQRVLGVQAVGVKATATTLVSAADGYQITDTKVGVRFKKTQ